MRKKLNVWIHCRVSHESERYLLNYQKETLLKLVNHSSLKVIGISSEISKGINPNSRELNAIKTGARRKEIDAVLVYDKTRILIYEDMYMEFKMFCEMFNTTIMCLQDIETSMHNIIQLSWCNIRFKAY